MIFFFFALVAYFNAVFVQNDIKLGIVSLKLFLRKVGVKQGNVKHERRIFHCYFFKVVHAYSENFAFRTRVDVLGVAVGGRIDVIVKTVFKL